MPNKCSIIKCRGNYDDATKCRVFRLPKDEQERQKWLNVLPPLRNFDIDPSKFFICDKHWPADTPMKTVPGGHSRPISPPSIFNDIPSSCLPTPKPSPRGPKVEDRQLGYFLKKDWISSFAEFSADKELNKQYDNIIISRNNMNFICLFMKDDYSECFASVIVHNKHTLTLQ